jgi:hypothetical protein
MQYKPGGWAGKQEAGRQSSHSVTSRRRKIYFQLYRERGRDREKEREREREREKKRRERERERDCWRRKGWETDCRIVSVPISTHGQG